MGHLVATFNTNFVTYDILPELTDSGLIQIDLDKPNNLSLPNVEETPNDEVTLHETAKKTGRVTQHLLDGFYRLSRRQ